MTRTLESAAILLVLLAATLAGCADDGVGKQQSPPVTDGGGPMTPSPSGSAPAAATISAASGTGSIRGIVTDDELVPITGVAVRIPATGHTSLSDEAGAFTMRDVPAGRQDLALDHERYQSTGRSVDVPADGAVDVAVILERLAFAGAYHETLVFDAYVPAGEGIIDIVVCEELDGDCIFNFTAEHNLVAVVEEFDFTPTLPNPSNGGMMYFQLRHTDAAGALYQDGTFAPRARFVVEGDWPRDERVPFWEFVGCEVRYVCLDQRITAWVTLFYVEAPDDDFTALEADA